METKVVVISGCSSGIGLAAAVLLASESGKYKVFATMRNLESKTALEQAAGDNLNKTLFIRELDVSKEDSVKSFAQDILKCEGRVDILVNNAGYGLYMTPLEDVPLQDCKRLFDVNFFGNMNLTQQFIPSMKKRKSGHIIFVSSSVISFGLPFGEMYTASKYALHALAEILAPQLAFFGVKVSTVVPGPTATQFASKLVVPDVQPVSDPDTKTVMAAMGKNLEKYMFNEEYLQTKEEVAHYIKKAIESSGTDLHTYTSEHVLELVKKKFTDPSGQGTSQGITDLFLKGVELQ